MFAEQHGPKPLLPSTPPGYVIKLVRDGYEGRDSGGIRFRGVGHNQHVRLLHQKLLEEVGEYLTNPCPEELADVYEVLRALARVELGEEPECIGGIALAKHRQRGGFERGIVMLGEPLPDKGSPDA